MLFTFTFDSVNDDLHNCTMHIAHHRLIDGGLLKFLSNYLWSLTLCSVVRNRG